MGTVAETPGQAQPLTSRAEHALEELRCYVLALRRAHADRIVDIVQLLALLPGDNRPRTVWETRRDESTTFALQLGHVLTAIDLVEASLGGTS